MDCCSSKFQLYFSLTPFMKVIIHLMDEYLNKDSYMCKHRRLGACLGKTLFNPPLEE